MHLKKAKEKGFTQAEIDEAAWVGISFDGSPAMVFYEQFKNSQQMTGGRYESPL